MIFYIFFFLQNYNIDQVPVYKPLAGWSKILIFKMAMPDHICIFYGVPCYMYKSGYKMLSFNE